MTRSGRALVAAGLGVSLLLGGVASYWASTAPDGLDAVAEEHGFAGQAQDSPVRRELAPVPGYRMPGVQSPFLAVSLAGMAGTLGCFAVALAIGWLVRRRKRSPGAV